MWKHILVGIGAVSLGCSSCFVQSQLIRKDDTPGHMFEDKYKEVSNLWIETIKCASQINALDLSGWRPLDLVTMWWLLMARNRWFFSHWSRLLVEENPTRFCTYQTHCIIGFSVNLINHRRILNKKANMLLPTIGKNNTFFFYFSACWFCNSPSVKFSVHCQLAVATGL
jgi:hypothetical protein